MDFKDWIEALPITTIGPPPRDERPLEVWRVKYRDRRGRRRVDRFRARRGDVQTHETPDGFVGVAVTVKGEGPVLLRRKAKGLRRHVRREKARGRS